MVSLSDYKEYATVHDKYVTCLCDCMQEQTYCVTVLRKYNNHGNIVTIFQEIN